MPKQDKGGGIIPPPRALACGLEDDAAGRHLPPRRIPSPAFRSLATRGKPAFGGRNGNAPQQFVVNFFSTIAFIASICYNKVSEHDLEGAE